MNAGNGTRPADPQRLMADRLRAAARLAGENWDPATTPWQIRDLIAGAAAATAAPSSLRPHHEILEQVYESLAGDDPAMSTGFPELDDMIGGVVPGEMIVLGGRPGSNKTSLALCIADHLASGLEQTVLYSTLEMSARALTLRRMARAAGVPLRRLQRYQTTDLDDRRITDVYGPLAATQLLIDDTRHQPLAAMRSRLGALAAAGDPARLHVVDHVGLMSVPSGMPRNEALADAVRGLSDTAVEHQHGVLVLAQLNRGLESRKDHEPQLGDLKGTGELEEIADIVLLLAADGTDLKVVVAKNRNGDTGTVTLTRQPEFARITSPSWSPSRHASR